MRSSKGWLAVYYDAPGAPPEIIRVFTPRNYFDYSKMMIAMTEFNYNTCLLCPIVKMEMDYTA